MSGTTMRRLQASGFTVFRELDLPLAAGLNVVLGENGAGKSHLLKLLYAVARSTAAPDSPLFAHTEAPNRAYLSTAIAEKLVGVFRPLDLGRLSSRRRGKTRTVVRVEYADPKLGVEFSFASGSQTAVTVDRLPKAWLGAKPVYLPTRELLSIYPGFVSLYEQSFLEFDETWRDLALDLGTPLRRGPRSPDAAAVLSPFEDAAAGRVVLENGRFYLDVEGEGRFEMGLVAEGFRKIGMVAQLAANGTLGGSGFLFWDEPEANLNAKLVRVAAEMIMALVRNGVQVVIATHSLFLVRELELLLRGDPDSASRSAFIGLQRTPEGVTAVSGGSLSELGDVTAIDETLDQAQRYLRTADAVG